MRLCCPDPQTERSPPDTPSSAPKPMAFSDAVDGAWAALVKARETRTLFHALPAERRELFYRLHDQVIVGLSGAPQFDPAIVSPGMLQDWIWASAKDESDARDLEAALHVLLALAADNGLRRRDAFPRWPRKRPLPSNPIH